MSTTSTAKADAHVRSSAQSGNAKSVSIVDREKAAIAAGLFMATDTFVHHQFWPTWSPAAQTFHGAG